MKSSLISLVALVLATVSAQAQNNLSPHLAEPRSDYENLRNTIMMIEQGVKAHESRFVKDFFDSAMIYNGNSCLNKDLENKMVGYFDYNSKDTTQLRTYFNTFVGNIVPVFVIHEANVLRTGENLLVEQDGARCIVGDTISVEMKMVAGHAGGSITSKLVFVKRSNEEWLPSENFVVKEIKDDGLIEAISTYADAYAAFKLGNGAWAPEWNMGYASEFYDFIDAKPRSCVNKVEEYMISYNSLIPVPIDFTVENNSYSYWNINSEIANNNFNATLIGSIDDIFVQEGPYNAHTLFITDRTFNRVFMGDFAATKFLTQPWYDAGYTGHVYSQLTEMHRYPDENQFVSYDRIAKRFDHFYYDPYLTVYGLHSMGGQRLVPTDMSLSQFFTNTSPTDSGYRNTIWVSYLDTLNPGLMQYFSPTQYFVPLKVFNGVEVKCGNTLTAQRFSSPPLFSIMEHFGKQYGIWAPQRILLCAGARVHITDIIDAVYDNAVDTTLFPILYSSELCDTYYRSPNICMVDNLSSGSYIVSDKSNGLVHLFDSYRGKYICSYANSEEAFLDFIGMRHVKADYGAYSGCSQVVRMNYDLYTAQDWNNGAGLRRYLEGVEVLAPRIEFYDPTNSGVMEVSVVLTGDARIDLYSLENGQKNFWYRDMMCGAGKMLLSAEIGVDTLVVEYVPAGNSSYGEYAVLPRKVYFLADSTVQIQKSIPKVPTAPRIHCYPQPAVNMLTVEYETENEGFVRITLHNMLGENLGVIYQEYTSAGRHFVSFNMPSLSSGIYLIKATADRSVVTEKIIYNK